MPSQGDVKVKDVDAIHAYNAKLGDFLGVFQNDLTKISNRLVELRTELEKRDNAAKEQYAEAKAVAKQVRQEWDNLMSQESRDPHAVADCRRRLDHFEGHVPHMIRNESDLISSNKTIGMSDINRMLESVSTFSARVINLVDQGQLFLRKSEDFIRDYQGNHL